MYNDLFGTHSVIGLDNSGKSTLLNHFKPEENQNQNIGTMHSYDVISDIKPLVALVYSLE